MKRPDYAVLLKILATAAVASVIYAAAVTFRTGVFGTDGGLVSIAYFVITMLLGYMAGRVFLSKIPIFIIKASASGPVKFMNFMLNLGDAACSVSAFAAWIMALLPILAALFIFMRQGIFRIAFEVIAAIIIYAFALKYSQFNFQQIMTKFAMGMSFTILASCLEILNFIDKMAYLRPWLLVSAYFFILVYLLVRNQEDIDSNIFDKKHIEKSILPKNLRRFNTYLIGMMFLAVVLLFNLKPLVIFLLQLIAKILIYAIAVFLWLTGHLFPSGNITQQGGSGGGFDFFGAGTEVVQPFRNLIFNVIRDAIILYALYRLILIITKHVPGLAHKIILLIKKLLGIKKGEPALVTADYSDETETVKPIREIGQRRHLEVKMRKSRRTLKNISDPVEKVRYMYAAIMRMLPMLGIRAEPYDTTADILKKAASAADISNELSSLTTIYDQVRYGEKIPDGKTLVKAEGHFDKTVEVIGQK